MKELVESIAQALVDHPEGVQVKAVEGSQVTVLELRVHPEDLGKVIGRQGRTAKAIRTLLGAAGMKLRKGHRREFWKDWGASQNAGSPLPGCLERAGTKVKLQSSCSRISRSACPRCRKLTYRPLKDGTSRDPT